MTQLWQRAGRLSLAQQFMIGSLVVLLAGMAGIGAWVARQIEDGVVQRTAATTALYVDSLVASALQDLAAGPDLSAAGASRLEWLFAETPLGREVLLFQVWDRTGRIVYSTVPGLVGQQFPTDPQLNDAFAGRVSADLGEPEGGDLLRDTMPQRDLLEIYSPVRSTDTDQVIAVAEFYYAADELRDNIVTAQRRSWLLVAGATAVIYLLLSAFVGRASDTIQRQQRALSAQVVRLTDLLRQNEELHQRARGAAERAVALNERFLRRFSAELHDGPAQDISLALLRLDNVAAHYGGYGDGSAATLVETEVGVIQASLRRALQELRSTSSGILLPQLGTLPVAAAVDHVTRGHRRRNDVDVEVVTRDLPEQAPLATKIAIYRIIQEALNNAVRHAGGANVAVVVSGEGNRLRVEVRDNGPGFDPDGERGTTDRLGLAGMRERAESLGGDFRVESAPGAGTRIVAVLPLPEGDSHG
jgi:signal transduction histidine kinase